MSEVLNVIEFVFIVLLLVAGTYKKMVRRDSLIFLNEKFQKVMERLDELIGMNQGGELQCEIESTMNYIYCLVEKMLKEEGLDVRKKKNVKIE